MIGSQQKRTGRVGRGACDAATRHALRHVPLASAISAILAGVPVAQAQQAQATGGLEEVVVTAQKVSENLQNVPISIQVLGNQKLEELHVSSLDDYVKYMPSVAYSRGQGQGGNAQPGESHVYMRGVVSGANENHSGSQPSVGTYMDEQPVTTIDGTVDVHIYDIQRIEVLEGPQGTLYGASSQAGTVRIITNKPDPSGFAAGYDFGVNRVSHGGTGYEAEGFVNLPLSPIAAIRLVAWDEKDAGFISNVAGTNAGACIVNGIRTFPTWDGVPNNYPTVTPCPAPGVVGAGAISNAAFVKKDYNTADTKGGRAALKLFLGDNWTITPTVMGQSVGTEGFFAYDPAVGDLQVAHFGPEDTQDAWTQSALTVEGKFSDFDLTYATAYMKRTTHGIADYSDYSEFYDRVYGSGANWKGNNGLPIMPQELVASHHYFEKWSHELRISTPQNLPVKATAGVFIERQLHNIFESYQMPGYNGDGFATSLSIPSQSVPSIWLTDETRVDRDKAAFAQVTWDVSSQLALSAGGRHYISDNTLQGFYGYSYNYHLLTGYSTQPGQSWYTCQTGVGSPLTPPTTIGAPCTDIAPSGQPERVTASGNVPRYNLTYKATPDKMFYVTYSEGFRPGGVNRTAAQGIGPYLPDYLKNYEIGWKMQFFGHTVRWNGAIFREDWNNFQFSFLGPNSVTIIENAAAARIKGIESELEWAVTNGLTLTSGVTFLDPRLTQNYCGTPGVTSCANQVTSFPFGPNVNGPLAPAGTNLPVSPKFKGNVIVRYRFETTDGWQPIVQAAWVYQTQTAPALKISDAQSIGMQPAYGLVDLTGGMNQHGTNIELVITNVLDRRAQLTRFEQCTVTICNQPYIVPTQPRTIGLKFGQKF
jgi:iron complex outermembrane recepter protein